jgi:FliI/YscN family ATPase
MERRGAWQPLATGVRVLDGLLTCARGQRLGVIGPAGSGKTTLLRMAAAHARADVVVLALVGERGREVFEAAGDLLSRERPLVVVASSPYDPPALRLMTAHAATAIAEDFRDQGAHVFLAVDSLTRLAHAQREIGLALGELPVTRAYPPSVFGLIPQLIERAGPAARGAITAFYSLLTEGDDLVDPVAEVAMASLDGQVVLARRLANQGLYPAVDLLRSLSRLMPEVVDPDQRRSAAQVRRLLQAYEEARDLVDAGLYRPGANGDVDRALRLMPRLLAFIAQTPSETSEPPATRRQVLLMAGLD